MDDVDIPCQRNSEARQIDEDEKQQAPDAFQAASLEKCKPHLVGGEPVFLLGKLSEHGCDAAALSVTGPNVHDINGSHRQR
jgi:hypothetical protein